VLAFTRDSFASRLLCTNQPSVKSPCPPTLPTLVQYSGTIIEQYETPLPTSHLYAIHHTIWVITISCKGQAGWECSSQHPSGLTSWHLHDIGIANIVWCIPFTRGVGGRHILHANRAIVLQSCGHCRCGAGQ